MSTTYLYNPNYAIHPGETLREKLEELQMRPNEFAIRTGKPTKTISNILNAKSSITPEMAVQFEKVLSIPAIFWIKKQANYNEFIAKEKYKQDINAAKDWVNLFPYNHMANLGIVKDTKIVNEKIEELFNFFDIAKHTAWENIYFNQKTPIYFRISLKHKKNPYSLSVLLQLGKLEAKKIEAPIYNKTLLKTIIPQLKTLMIESPNDFLQKIQILCLKAGVKVIYTPIIKNTVTNGVVRWIDNNPVIQMTDLYKKYDVFWFSLFHEIGHIILHANKKNIFLEESQAIEKSKEEKEADKFAIEILLPSKKYCEIESVLLLEKNILSIISDLAKHYDTHQDIILGRFLLKNKQNKYKYLFSKIKKVKFHELLDL